ncbi:threonine/serine exporter family protein [Weissella halotolerans]|uniref:Threonine/serine exporter-like N-terminal domain-containing protein n=1 Tax=Weissella halotolerans DSM 20190 TaxID=1123500 RepID=A0A0R2G5W9_9LACO|nr:threonine/serine exporter family protein [Weissella halotolerans]KRN33557.1 hypothetical protein IV68_GL000363 [Weissella halotolerans DSM 20190]
MAVAHSRRKEKLLVARTCLIASQILMENGSEMTRISDTVKYIADTYKPDLIDSYITSSLIIISIKDDEVAGDLPVALIENTSVKSINLNKVEAVNTLSRAYSNHEMNIRELNKALKRVRQANMTSAWQADIGGLVLSLSLTYFLTHDVLAACLAGGLGFLCMYWVDIFHQWLKRPFLGELLVSALITSVVQAIMLVMPLPLDNEIIIGALFPMLPGVQLTTALNDILDGNLISGPQRLLSALLLTFTMGLGSIMALTVWR